MIQVLKAPWEDNESGYDTAIQVGAFPVTVNGLLDAMACMAYEDDQDSAVHIELFGEVMPMMPQDRLNEKQARLELQRSPAYQAFLRRKEEFNALSRILRPLQSAKRSMAI